MDEGRKRVLAIVAGILVARHLKTTEDLFDTRDSPRTRSMVIAAVRTSRHAPEELPKLLACLRVRSGQRGSWERLTMSRSGRE
jgi:hypothetical protein